MPISFGAPAKGPFRLGLQTKGWIHKCLRGDFAVGIFMSEKFVAFLWVVDQFQPGPIKKNKDHSRLRNFDPKKMVVLR